MVSELSSSSGIITRHTSVRLFWLQATDLQLWRTLQKGICRMVWGVGVGIPRTQDRDRTRGAGEQGCDLGRPCPGNQCQEGSTSAWQPLESLTLPPAEGRALRSTGPPGCPQGRPGPWGLPFSVAHRKRNKCPRAPPADTCHPGQCDRGLEILTSDSTEGGEQT